MQEAESSHCPQPMRLMERSVFCDRMVFVKAMVADKLMSEDELSIYDAWCSLIYSDNISAFPNRTTICSDQRCALANSAPQSLCGR